MNINKYITKIKSFLQHMPTSADERPLLRLNVNTFKALELYPKTFLLP